MSTGYDKLCGKSGPIGFPTLKNYPMQRSGKLVVSSQHPRSLLSPLTRSPREDKTFPTRPNRISDSVKWSPSWPPRGKQLVKVHTARIWMREICRWRFQYETHTSSHMHIHVSFHNPFLMCILNPQPFPYQAFFICSKNSGLSYIFRPYVRTCICIHSTISFKWAQQFT